MNENAKRKIYLSDDFLNHYREEDLGSKSLHELNDDLRRLFKENEPAADPLPTANKDLRRILKEEDDAWVDRMMAHRESVDHWAENAAEQLRKSAIELTQEKTTPFNLSLPTILISLIIAIVAIPLFLCSFYLLTVHSLIFAKLISLAVAFCQFLFKSHILNFGFYTASGLAGLVMLLTNRLIKPPPTHLIISPEKLVAIRTSKDIYQKWLRSEFSINIRRGAGQVGQYFIQASFDWEALRRVFVDSRTNASEAAIFCFQTNEGNITKLRLGDMLSSEVRRKLLKALQDWAPQAEIEPEAYALLEPIPETSFTELWIAAFSAPPSRERILPLDPGVKLKGNEYEITSQLASGGQGIAYVAKAKQNPEQAVVLKEYILPIYVTRDTIKHSVQSVEHEATILKSLSHDKIVKCLDSFIEDHRAYLVLEHINGDNLRSLMQNKRTLPENEVLGIASQMCEILAYLHSQSPPIIHKDFTPDNLILQTTGALKLIDFNIAQELSKANSSAIAGKAAYMPIEQIQGSPTTQSDIYSMGACLYFLLTGEDPEPISVSQPRHKRSEISEKLDKLVAKCTQLSTTKRYESITALSEEIGTLNNSL